MVSRALGVMPVAPELRQDLVRHTAEASLRSNLLSFGLIGLMVVLLRDAGVSGWLTAWAVYAVVVTVLFDRGVRHSRSRETWTRTTSILFASCFLLSGTVYGSFALLPLEGPAHAGDQATVSALLLLSIAAGLVFGAARTVEFLAFHGAVSVLGCYGLARDGAYELVVLVAFGAIASLPLRGELSQHIVDATILARRNAALVEELSVRQEEIERAYASLAAANAELSLQATHDPLTGLANRAAFAHALEEILTRTRSGDGVCAVLYFDLDRFKIVNDTYGHAVGDDLLCQVAQRLRPAMEGQGLLCRLGGDEFTAVLRTPTRESALDVAVRIRDCFATPFALDGHVLTISTSAGLAFDDDPSLTSEGLVGRADAALYRAKHLGRDRLEIDGAVSDSPSGLEIDLS